MNKLLYLFILITFNSFAQTKMSNSEASSLRTKIKSLAETTKSVTADFIQYKHLDFLADDIESNGKLFFKSPNLIKWSYIKPFKYSILFKENTLYIDNEGEKNKVDIGANKLFKQLNKLISASVTGDMFNAEEFDISYFKKGSRSLVIFSPKDKKFAKFIKQFQIIFNSDAKVSEVKMIESSNDYTNIIFSNRKTNQNISDAVFAQ